MKRLALLFVAFLALTAQRDPVLVPEVSQHRVELQQGFTGTTLLLFGAVLGPGGVQSGDPYDVVVVLRGPSQPIRLREKQQVGGVWMNADALDFRSAPSYFAVASNRPIDQIVDDRTAAIFEFGTDFIQLSPSGTIDPEEQARFRDGLVDLRQRQGLYLQDFAGVELREGVLYQARIALPSNVQVGTYTAETFAISNGRVVASAIAEVEVEKVGFGRFVEFASLDWSFFYGLIAISLSVGMGWIAGRLFALI
ncbi:TIGR02186 family protein [Parerythrobacter aurantius]|uniref:TIGR02186 family protein n=1 Tax=Parerythrobacter aurantius TaxID=3127706 RepID=UPI00324F374E